MYAAITTRPDIMFAVNYISRFQENPNQAHWNAAKRILKYLKGTQEYGIKYTKDAIHPNLIGYSDSDFANDQDTRRSTTG